MSTATVANVSSVASLLLPALITSGVHAGPAFPPFAKAGCFREVLNASCCHVVALSIRDVCPTGGGYVVPFCEAIFHVSPTINHIYWAETGEPGFDGDDIDTSGPEGTVLCEYYRRECSATAPGGCNELPGLLYAPCDEWNHAPDSTPCIGPTP